MNLVYSIFAANPSPLLRSSRERPPSQSRLPRRRPRHAVPPRHQGAAQGNAAAGGQADHPVRRRGGRRLGPRQHHPGHRPRQERHRGPFRRVDRTRDVPRGPRQDRAARRGPQDLESDQRRVRPPGRAARPGSRRARHARADRRRAVRRHPGRRRDRRRPAGDQPDDRRLRARRRAGARRRARAARRDLQATASSPPTAGVSLGDGIYEVADLVEKPAPQDAPSDLAIIGRYILTPDIFPALAATQERPHGRDSAHQRPARAAPAAADLCV